MPLTFPLAETPRAALDAEATARTVGEARDKAGATVSLVSEWLRPSASERESLQGRIDAGVAAGFAQIYEDQHGQPVIAVTFWKRGLARAVTFLAAEPPPAAAAASVASSDTVDDLYFEKGRSASGARRRRDRARQADPNQLDLFGAADPRAAKASPAGDVKEKAGASKTGAAKTGQSVGADKPAKGKRKPQAKT